MAGDYTKFQRHYTNLTTDFEIIPISPNPFQLLTPRIPAWQIFIQKAELVVSVYTGVATTVLLQGRTSARVYARFNIPATPSNNATDIYQVDYGPTGLGINIGEGLDAVFTSGIDAMLHIEAYQKQALTVGSNASN